MLSWLARVALSACPAGPATAAEVVDHAELAVLAYVGLDEAGLRAELELLEASITCLDELMLPADVAAHHRALALGAFVRGDEVAALAAYRAALRIQPQFKLSTSLAPPGGPIADLYSSAGLWSPPEPYALPDTAEGTVYVDGVQALEAPGDLPALVQVVRPDGSVHWSQVIRGPDQLPGWFAITKPPIELPAPAPALPPPAPAKPPTPAPLPPEPTHPGHARAGLWIGATVAAAGAGGLFTGAALSRTDYERTPTASGRQRTNSLFLGSVGLGTAAASLGLAAAIVPGGDR